MNLRTQKNTFQLQRRQNASTVTDCNFLNMGINIQSLRAYLVTCPAFPRSLLLKHGIYNILDDFAVTVKMDFPKLLRIETEWRSV